MDRHRKEQGLTLVEIMIVLIIIGLVMGFVATKLTGAGDKAKAELTRIRLEQLKQDIEQYRLRYNALPNSLDDLTRCSEQTGPGCIPITDVKGLGDGWNNRLAYELINSGRAYRIKSFGADGRDGGEGVNYDVFVEGP